MFDRSDPGSHDVGVDLQSEQRGVYASCNPGNHRFKAVVELLDTLGILGDLPESNQISLFDFMVG